jgi:hypothetical protein
MQGTELTAGQATAAQQASQPSLAPELVFEAKRFSDINAQGRLISRKVETSLPRYHCGPFNVSFLLAPIS